MEGSRAGTYQVAYHVEGSSGDGLQRPRLDDPRGSPDDPQPRLEYDGTSCDPYDFIQNKRRRRVFLCR